MRTYCSPDPKLAEALRIEALLGVTIGGESCIAVHRIVAHPVCSFDEKAYLRPNSQKTAETTALSSRHVTHGK